MRTIDDIKSGMETAVILGDLPYALNRIDEAYRLGKQALYKKPLQDRIDRAVEVLGVDTEVVNMFTMPQFEVKQALNYQRIEALKILKGGE